MMSFFDMPLTFPADWPRVRGEFSLTDKLTELSGMSMASNPHTVAKRIRDFQLALDDSPHQFAKQNFSKFSPLVFDAIGHYFNVPAANVAFTHSTTLGLAQIYGGVRIAASDEILASVNEHLTTAEALRLRCRRHGTLYRQVPLFRDSRTMTVREVVGNVARAIRPTTRVLALTWVYSSDGVMLPLKDIAKAVTDENLQRGPNQDPLLFLVDGVHGFGVKNVVFDDLGCDAFVAGCHKWTFGPRGTAMMCAKREAWAQMVPIVPSFASPHEGVGQMFTLGGTFAFEHFWALAEAFRFIDHIGKPNIATRIEELCTAAKTGLAAIPGVIVRTPMDPALSAGIVAFDVKDLPADKVILKLRDEFHISATESGLDATLGRTHARFSPGIFNSLDEIHGAVDAVKEIARQH